MNTPEASGTARKAPSGALSGAPSRNLVRASTPSKALTIRNRKKPSGEVGGGVALKSMAHPPGLIAKMADAIKSRKLSFRKPLAKDADKTLMATKPWEKEGVSRRTWYRRRGKA